MPETKKKLSDAEVRKRLAERMAPHRRYRGATATDPATRTRTVVLHAGGAEAQNETIGKPTPKDELEVEAQPRLRQEDARDVPQRSATLTGSAHPVTAGEPQPHARQEDYQDVPQSSATPLGQATPIQTTATQQQAEKTAQRSATPLGEAVPKPDGDLIHQARNRDASVKTDPPKSSKSKSKSS